MPFDGYTTKLEAAIPRGNGPDLFVYARDDGTIERLVCKSEPSVGYKTLRDMDMEDFAFEAVVLRHPSVFSPKAIAISKERLGR